MADNAPLIERAFSIEVHEGSADLSVEGVLPPFLSGTAYWNGPGRFARGSLQYRHWLDGDGLVCALAFRGGGARTTARYVRSEKFVAEESAGRALFRQFGTAFPGDQLKRGIGIESPANVSAYPYGGALLAFGEQGLPWALDPQTLETRGLFTFNGQLNEITPFSAHPKFDHRTGEMFNFGVAFAKAQLAVGQRLPERGTAFVSVNNDDKPNLLPIARDLAELGFRLIATRGTAAYLRAYGLHVDVVFKVNEGRPNVADEIVNRKVDLVVNTPLGRESFFDDRAVRRAAMMHEVPCITTLTGAAAAVSAIRAMREQGVSVRALQDYYAGIAAGTP